MGRDGLPNATRTAASAIALDGHGAIASWRLHVIFGLRILKSPGATERWSLAIDPAFKRIKKLQIRKCGNLGGCL
jgi:hypothetical protein